MSALIMGAVMISFSAVFVKLTAVEPTVSAFYRMFFGGLVLGALALVGRERLWFGWSATAAIALAALFFAGDLFFWHRSILAVGPGLATLLANFQVFLLALAGVLLLHEPLRWRVVAAIALAMAGLSLLVGADWAALSPDYRAGVGFGLLTAVCYAAYILALRLSRVNAAAPSSIAVVTPLSLACAAILAILLSIEGQRFALPGWRDAGLLFAYGIAAQVLGWRLIAHGLASVRASQAGLVLLLQPTLAFVWDVALFGRAFTVFEGIGALLAIAGIYLGSRRV